MAKSAAIFPSWVRTLGAMIDHHADIQVSCTKCGVYKTVPLRNLANQVGRNYSLINRRCLCRLTGGCKGWNRFFYRNGVFRPLWDDGAARRWVAMESAESRAIDSQAVND